MPSFNSADVTTYSLAAGIDFRSGAPASCNGLVVASANVTNGSFNGSSSWTTIAGLSLGSVAAVTAVLNIPSQNGKMLYEYSVNCDSNAGFYSFGIGATSLRGQANGGGGHQSDDVPSPQGDLSGGSTVLCTQWDVTSNPFALQVSQNGGTPDAGSPAGTAGTFGASTLYIGARASSSLWLAGTIDFLLVHSAWQSDGLRAALAANPYAVLAAAGGTLSKVNAIAVASISKVYLVNYASVKAVNALTTGN